MISLCLMRIAPMRFLFIADARSNGSVSRKTDRAWHRGVHISNVFFDLAPVVGNLAYDAGLTALLQSDSAVSEAEQKQGKYPSIWVVVTRHAEDLLPLKKDGRWKELRPAPELSVWTDNFSNVLDVLRRRRLR